MGKCRRKVWVTGAAGLIGHHILLELLKTPDVVAIPITRRELDLESESAVEQMFAMQRPDAIVHCAAYTDTSFCEQHPERAHAVNVVATARLAALAVDIPFVFFSTDLVFDGKEGNYSEAAMVCPLSVYARTKVDAEELVLKNPAHTVVRTSMTAGVSAQGRGGFDTALQRAWLAGEEVKLFTDEFRNPIHASITARAIGEIVSGMYTGLFHLAGAERLSRYEIGQTVARRYPELNARICAASLLDYALQTRPADCSMDCSKLQRLLSFRLPSFREWYGASAN